MTARPNALYVEVIRQRGLHFLRFGESGDFQRFIASGQVVACECDIFKADMGGMGIVVSKVTLSSSRLVHGPNPAIHVQLGFCTEIIGSHARMFCLKHKPPVLPLLEECCPDLITGERNAAQDFLFTAVSVIKEAVIR